MEKLRVWRGTGAYQRAVTALPDGQRLCGVYLEGGAPAYFAMPSDATDDAVAERAFEVRHGRPVLPVERQLRELAEAHVARTAARG